MTDTDKSQEKKSDKSQEKKSDKKYSEEELRKEIQLAKDTWTAMCPKLTINTGIDHLGSYDLNIRIQHGSPEEMVELYHKLMKVINPYIKVKS